MGTCLIWVYRFMNIPKAGEKGRWAWIGMFIAELWFGFYWIITQSVRWNVIHRCTFKDRLINRSYPLSIYLNARVSLISVSATMG